MVHLVFANQHWVFPEPGFTQKRMYIALAKECEKTGDTVIGCHNPSFLMTGLAKLRRNTLKRIAGMDVLRQVGSNLYYYMPLLLIPPSLGKHVRLSLKFNNQLLRRQVKRLLSRFGAQIKDALLWFFHPNQRYLYDRFPEASRVYRVFDNYEEEPFWDEKAKECIRVNEKHFLNTADVVLATSYVLREDKLKHRSSVELLPNGVDLDLFSRALDENLPVPADIENLPRPRVGFVGKLNFKIDFGLVNYLAKSRSGTSFVFIGPNDGTEEFNNSPDFLEARNIRNIHFFGTRPYDSLPGCLKGFDACIIPFVLNEYTKRIYPLKIHEYLAAGRPVVSTSLPDLRAFSYVAGIAENKVQFLELLDSAVADKSKENIKKRVEIAAENSWEERAKSIMELTRKLHKH